MKRNNKFILITNRITDDEIDHMAIKQWIENNKHLKTPSSIIDHKPSYMNEPTAAYIEKLNEILNDLF